MASPVSFCFPPRFQPSPASFLRPSPLLLRLFPISAAAPDPTSPPTHCSNRRLHKHIIDVLSVFNAMIENDGQKENFG